MFSVESYVEALAAGHAQDSPESRRAGSGRTLMRRSNLATLLYLLLVFASGTVVGGFANRLYMAKTVSAPCALAKTRAEFRKQYIEEMRSRSYT